MKKKMFIIVFFLIPFIVFSGVQMELVDTSIPVVFADEEADKKQDKLETELEAANKNLERAEQLEKTYTSERDKTTREKVTKKAQSEVNRLNSEINNIKRDRIIENYKTLSSGATEQGKEIQKQIEQCKDCDEKDILVQRLEANKRYIAYLKTREALDLCEGPDDCDEDALKAARDREQAASAHVREMIIEISDAERDREIEKKFEVSRIFSIEGKKRTFDVQTVVNTIANWMITLVSTLAVTTLIIGGFLMIISGGDESRLETGKTIFTYSLIGIVVTLMAYGIISFIQSLFYG